MRIAYCLLVVFLCTLSGELRGQQTARDGAGQNYLAPGDIVRLRIWREESMSGEYPVDADGNVVLPRLGVWPVTGKDPTGLRTELVEAYSRYLRSPAIEIVFLRRIVVGGAVQRPGVYHVDPTMTVRDVVLQAGGPTPLGSPDRVELVRDGEEIEAQIRQDAPILESAIRSGDQLYVPERGWLSRNTNAAVGIGGALLSFVATMIILAASK